MKLLCEVPLRDLQNTDTEWGLPPGLSHDSHLSEVCPIACGFHGFGPCAVAQGEESAGTGSPAASSTPSSPLTRLSTGGAKPIEPTDGVSNVVFTLMRSDEDASVFIERSKCLDRALLHRRHFDQIIFHEGDLPEATVKRIQSHFANAHVHTRFVDAHAYGAFTTPPDLVEQLPDLDRSHLGYRHMVSFPCRARL